MRIKVTYAALGVFFLFFMVAVPDGFARTSVYYLHRGPGRKFKIIGRVHAKDPIHVLQEETGWVRIRTSGGKEGWISERTFHRGWKGRHLSVDQAKVDIRFQNIPKECVRIMVDNLNELKRHLPPVGDKTLELIISAMPRIHSYRMFLVIDFNARFYRRTMKRFNLPTTIDLLPYNGCIWALYGYKQALIRGANKRSSAACGFMRRFTISLILRRRNGEEVILETVEDGVYIYFSPFLILKEANGRVFRVMSEEPKKVGLLSAFALPYPLEKGDPASARAYEVYRFFRARP